MLTERYQRLVAELADLAARRADAERELERWYDEELATATARAGAQAARARRAGDLVSHVDTSAARVWQALADRLGPVRAARLGPLPAPAAPAAPAVAAPGAPTPTPAPAEPDPAGVALRRAAHLLATLDRRRPGVPRGVLAAFPAVGTLAAAALALPAHAAIVALGGNVVVTVLAQVLVFLAPFAGVPVVMAWTRRRFGTGPQVAGVALTVLGGMLACWAVIVGTS